MTQFGPTGSISPQDKWQAITDARVNSVAGVLQLHLDTQTISNGVKVINGVDPKQILPFESAILPANQTVLQSLFPGYVEPSDQLLSELKTYGSAQENYGTAPGEAAALIVQLVKAIDPETAFVFGTARGRIEQLIANNSSNTEIATIDLPTELVSIAEGKPDSNNIRYRNDIGVSDDTKVGDIFTGDSTISNRVHQIFGDSYTFAPNHLAGKIRFTVIDANHQLPNSLMDIGNAVQLSHRDGAVIIVDDFRKASPLNTGVEGAVSIFCQITGLPALLPVPKPREAGLSACAAVIVIPPGFDTQVKGEQIKAMARTLKGFQA